jgi:hypothetical protein
MPEALCGYYSNSFGRHTALECQRCGWLRPIAGKALSAFLGLIPFTASALTVKML